MRHPKDGDLIYEVEGAIGVVTFNRPDALNAFNEELYHAAGDALVEADTRDDVACVVHRIALKNV